MDRRSQVKEEEEKDVVVVGPLEMMMMKKRKKVVGMQSSNSSTKCCQIERCSADMGDAKPYHRRHKVCEAHAKAEFVLLAGTRQRFCQQCSRFHELSEFDDSKRSCRWRLAGHNERRRKNTNPSESNSGQKMASNSQLTDKNPLCGGKAEAKEKGHIKYPGKGQLQALCSD